MIARVSDRFLKDKAGRKIQDLTERIFGRLEVIGQHEARNPHNEIQWDCVCICGKKVIATGRALKTGTTKSCGCYRKDLALAKDTYGLRTYKKFVRL